MNRILMVDETINGLAVVSTVSTAGVGVAMIPSIGGRSSGAGAGAGAGSCSNVNRHVFHRALCVAGKANPNIPPSVRNWTGRSVNDMLAGLECQHLDFWTLQRKCQT
jgi:hypothetical protein